MNYIIQWLHNYVIHFGAWVSLLIAADIYKKGLPESVKALRWLLLAAFVIASIGALVSSHSHTHYTSLLNAIVKE